MATTTPLVQIRLIAAGYDASRSLSRGCSSCIRPNCCSIEPPFLTQFDISQIHRATGLSEAEFSIVREDQIFQSLLLRKGSGKECIFYGPKGCAIYEVRPIDCRLYPLDIKVIDGFLTWILYETCPDNLAAQKVDWQSFAKLAESRLLMHFHDSLVAYANLPTKAFELGSWKPIAKVNFLA